MSSSRESCLTVGVLGRRLLVAPKDAQDLPGAGSQSASMAAQREGTTAPLRVLEEALGLGLTAAGDAEDAVAAEGTYYLERILLALAPGVCGGNGC